MDIATFSIIAVTVIVHAIGIGLFLVWFAAGRPMSKEALQRWWTGVQFVPEWLRPHKGGISPRCL